MAEVERGHFLHFGELSGRIYLSFARRQLGPETFEVVGRKVDVTNEVGRVLERMDSLGLALVPRTPARLDD